MAAEQRTASRGARAGIRRRAVLALAVAALATVAPLSRPEAPGAMAAETPGAAAQGGGWLISVAQAAPTPAPAADASPNRPARDRSASGGAVLTPWSPPDGGGQAEKLQDWLRSAQGTIVQPAAPRSPPNPVQPADAPAVPVAPVQGVSPAEIRFGMVAAFSGAVKDTGHNLMVGVEAAFRRANDAGGVNGRQLKLVTADDGYEPGRTVDAMRRLYEDDKVFGYLCNFGTATAAVAAPFALDRRAIFFGAFTGSNILRRDPPDRYVFNYRASYGEETAAVLRYLLNVKRLRPDQIAVFAQDDGFGDAGYEGAQKELRRLLGVRATDLLRLTYKRNTVDVSDAVAQVSARRNGLRAVIMVATYRAAAKLIERTRDANPALLYADVSGVGSTSFSDELTLLGAKYATGVIVTQIVPSIDSYATAILDYKTTLSKYYPGEKPDYVSLEGYISANLLIAGLKKAGPQLDSDRLVDALEALHNVDTGLGTLLGYSLTEHQASHKVWGTVMDGAGRYQPLDLD